MREKTMLHELRFGLSFAFHYLLTWGLVLITILGLASTFWCMGCLRAAFARHSARVEA
jgi:hypothetical protein